MFIMRRAWQDIRKGRQLELYLLLLTLIGIFIADIFGVRTDAVLSEIILASLAILVYGVLETRLRGEKTEEQMNKIELELRNLAETSNTFFTTEYPDECSGKMTTSHDLWLVGVTLNRTIRTHYSLIERKLKAGHRIHVLMVAPNSQAIRYAAERHYSPAIRDADTHSQEIQRNVVQLCDLQRRTSGSLEIRLIDSPLAFGAFGLDMDTDAGLLLIEHYNFRTSSDSIPKFVLYSSNAPWFGYFRDEIRALWASGVSAEC